jgi:hypothetical protein
MKRYRFAIHESTYGASTSCIVEVNRKNIIINVYDDSSYETNWFWDGWGNGFLESLIGKTLEEVREEMEAYFDDEDYEYRNPHIVESEYWGTPDPSTKVEPALV